MDWIKGCLKSLVYKSSVSWGNIVRKIVMFSLLFVVIYNNYVLSFRAVPAVSLPAPCMAWWETLNPCPHLVVALHRGINTWTLVPCRLAKCMTFQVKIKCQGRFRTETLSLTKDSWDCWKYLSVQTLAERYDTMSLHSHYLWTSREAPFFGGQAGDKTPVNIIFIFDRWRKEHAVHVALMLETQDKRTW